tara:strand:+ start:2211 stop:2732 length:522 start_codon:yes stop_codon:yes gene_type:complete
MSHTALNRLLDSAAASDGMPDDVKRRLMPVQQCSPETAWEDFVASVGDDDHPTLQLARTLILCETYLVTTVQATVFGVNSADRKRTDVLYNPNQNEETGKATERSCFVRRDVALAPTNIGALLEGHPEYRYVRICVSDGTEIYASLLPFLTKNLLVVDPIPSVLYEGIHVCVR